jgi:hypothetical protein
MLMLGKEVNDEKSFSYVPHFPSFFIRKNLAAFEQQKKVLRIRFCVNNNNKSSVSCLNVVKLDQFSSTVTAKKVFLEFFMSHISHATKRGKMGHDIVL